MRRRESGAIVNISSINGINPAALVAAYNVAKAGVISLTRTLALELAAYGVRVNAVLPGSTRTPMLEASLAMGTEIEKMIRANQPGGRFGLPEEIAEAVVWLCSGRASFVSGESMLVDGGAIAR